MPLTRIALLVLILALLGGLLYHHDSDLACTSCPLCHVGAQTPGASHIGALVVRNLNIVGRVDLLRTDAVASIYGATLTIPRAPPSPMRLVIL